MLVRSCDQLKPNLNQTKSKWKTIVEHPLKLTVDNDKWDHPMEYYTQDGVITIDLDEED